MMGEYTFVENSTVKRESVRFINRFGIELAGDLYLPNNLSNRASAIAFTGPFGAVKEQVSGLYAQELAARGFVTLAFDPSFTGESGGQVSQVASPEIFTEDFSAAVDFLGSLAYIDRSRIGIMGICGLSGNALTAASVDTRISAVATSVMYDISRSVSEGVGASMTKGQKRNFKAFLSQQRWNVVDTGKTITGPHEPIFLEDGSVLHTKGLPEVLPNNPHPVLKDFHDYYKKKRGYHRRSINSTGAWESRTPLSFLAFPQYSFIDEIEIPVLTITGEKAHSRYFSEEAHEKIVSQKEFILVPNASHVDLYDQVDKIPFDDIERFFKKSLK